MFNRKFTGLFILIALAAPLFAGGGAEAEVDKENYFVSIVPQAYLLERIVGDRAEVTVMVPPGKSPATYEPTPQQVMELGEAAAYFTLGVPFEQNFIPTIEASLPELRLIDGAAGIERRHLEAHDHEEEGHEEGDHKEEGHDDHEEGAIDPHVWFSPVLGQVIARNMAATVMADDPEGKDVYQANLDSLIQDLDTLDKELAEILAPVKGETLFVYHPAFGYFADRYGLHQEAIEVGGKEPSAAVLEHIIEEAIEDGVHIVLVQPEFAQASAEAVANAIGGVVVPVAPLSKDYINNMKALAQQLQEGLK
ncbi:MAG: zinc ABC transporter substrate-binding protein [Spirochaetales bacterium]|nr:zinc ABC transporter substrate-binding protein [Spirochaetales bacterium]